MSPEAIAGAAYAGFLIVAAIGLDHLARHTHNRSGRFRTQGFTYQPELDVLGVPRGRAPQAGRHRSSQPGRPYRARAAVCNNCPAKDGCTDSDQGREVVRQLDPWPHSEAGRFHRGISVALLGLASLIAGVLMTRNHSLGDLLLLGSAPGPRRLARGAHGSRIRRHQLRLPGRGSHASRLMEDVALFLHLLGVLLFTAGIVFAGVAFEAARRRQQPEEIALLLSLTRIGVLLVVLGGLLLLGFGLWLVGLEDVGGAGWVNAAIGLFLVVVGARRARRSTPEARAAACG